MILAAIIAIAISLIQIITISVTNLSQSNMVAIFLSTCQMVCAFVGLVLILSHELVLSSSKSSLSISRIHEINRQRKVLSDDSSIFSVTSLLKAKYDVKTLRRKHSSDRKNLRSDPRELIRSNKVNGYDQGTRTISKKSITRYQRGQDERDDLSSFGVSSKDIDCSDFSIGSDSSGVKKRSSSGSRPVLSNDQIYGEDSLSELSSSDNESHSRRRLSKSRNIVGFGLVHANSSHGRAYEVDGLIAYIHWKNRVVILLVFILLFISAIPGVYNSAIAALIISSIFSRLAEAVLVYCTMIDPSLDKNQYRRASKRLYEHMSDQEMIGSEQI